MHHFQTTIGNETVVAAPEAGQLLAGNAIGSWAPIEANTTADVKVLTQQSGDMPQWKQLSLFPEYNTVLQHEAIDDPRESDFGMPAIREMQFILVQILEVLRATKLIAPQSA